VVEYLVSTQEVLGSNPNTERKKSVLLDVVVHSYNPSIHSGS
jgi:hypothetical protein